SLALAACAALATLALEAAPGARARLLALPGVERLARLHLLGPAVARAVSKMEFRRVPPESAETAPSETPTSRRPRLQPHTPPAPPRPGAANASGAARATQPTRAIRPAGAAEDRQDRRRHAGRDRHPHRARRGGARQRQRDRGRRDRGRARRGRRDRDARRRL